MRKRTPGQVTKTRRSVWRDQGGNTLPFVAAAFIPLAAMIGGGLDIARAHLAKSRLSQACDAAALAGRRAMTAEDIETAKPEATKFFNYNFPQRYMDTATFTPTITRPERGTVKVAAATAVPTTVMRIFNQPAIPISVECDATQNYDNIDIVLVLDTTGSMDQSIGGEKKIVSLRKAVLALYDELSEAQTQLAAQGLRLRYSVVPYSSTVNVGKLVRAVNSSYIATSWQYQSRAPIGGGRFNYGARTFDVSSYVAGSSVDPSTMVGGSSSSVTWNGCIEERETTSTIRGNSSTSKSNIPASARDVDIDGVPTSNPNTKWGPQFDAVQYRPDDLGTGSLNVSNWCPSEAKRLGVMTRSEMQNYVNALTPTGPTYHNIGMAWGARFISRNGIFAADNPSTYNDRPVNRYVIFLTDGIMEPGAYNGSAYGVEYLDQKVNGGSYRTVVSDGSGSDLAARHNTRFLMACNVAREGGAQIWAIAFGLTAPDSLYDCAGNDDQVATSSNSADLIAKFKEIGKNIGALRLSK